MKILKIKKIKINFKLIAMVLIQAFLMMDFTWAGGCELIVNSKFTQTHTLAPTLYISAEYFKDKYHSLYLASFVLDKSSIPTVLITNHHQNKKIDKKLSLEDTLTKWKEYGLVEFSEAIEMRKARAIHIGRLKMDPELYTALGIMGAILSFCLFSLRLGKISLLTSIAGIGLIVLGVGFRAAVLLLLSYRKHKVTKLFHLAYRELFKRENFNQAEEYYLRLTRQKQKIESLLSVKNPLVPGLEGELSKEEKLRIEFKRIKRGLDPQESVLTNRAYYKLMPDGRLGFSSVYVWDDIADSWIESLSLIISKEDITPEFRKRIVEDKQHLIEKLEELIYGVSNDYIVLDTSKYRLNVSILEELLKLVQEYDWRDPDQLIKFDSEYMSLKFRHDIISWKTWERHSQTVTEKCAENLKYIQENLAKQLISRLKDKATSLGELPIFSLNSFLSSVEVSLKNFDKNEHSLLRYFTEEFFIDKHIKSQNEKRKIIELALSILQKEKEGFISKTPDSINQIKEGKAVIAQAEQLIGQAI